MALPLPVPDRQQYGPDARRLPAHDRPFDAAGQQAGGIPNPRHRNRLRLREDRPAGPELRLERVVRPGFPGSLPGNSLSGDRRAGRQIRHRLPRHADRRKDLGLFLLAPPQGERLAGRCLALPLPHPVGGTALACAGAGPAGHGENGRRRRRARTSVQPRSRPDPRPRLARPRGGRGRRERNGGSARCGGAGRSGSQGANCRPVRARGRKERTMATIGKVRAGHGAGGAGAQGQYLFQLPQGRRPAGPRRHGGVRRCGRRHRRRLGLRAGAGLFREDPGSWSRPAAARSPMSPS